MTDPTPPDVPVEEPKVGKPADPVAEPAEPAGSAAAAVPTDRAAVEKAPAKTGPTPRGAKVLPDRRHWSDTAAILLSSLVIPLPIFVGRLVEMVLDTINPSGVDVTQPLAYLSQILGLSFAALGVLLVAIVLVYVIVYRRHRTLDALKLPLLIVAIQIVMGVLILLFNALIDAA